MRYHARLAAACTARAAWRRTVDTFGRTWPSLALGSLALLLLSLAPLPGLLPLLPIFLLLLLKAFHLLHRPVPPQHLPQAVRMEGPPSPALHPPGKHGRSGEAGRGSGRQTRQAGRQAGSYDTECKEQQAGQRHLYTKLAIPYSSVSGVCASLSNCSQPAACRRETGAVPGGGAIRV